MKIMRCGIRSALIAFLALMMPLTVGCGSDFFALMSDLFGDASEGAEDLSDTLGDFEEDIEDAEDGDEVNEAFDDFWDSLFGG